MPRAARASRQKSIADASGRDGALRLVARRSRNVRVSRPQHAHVPPIKWGLTKVSFVDEGHQSECNMLKGERKGKKKRNTARRLLYSVAQFASKHLEMVLSLHTDGSATVHLVY